MAFALVFLGPVLGVLARPPLSALVLFFHRDNAALAQRQAAAEKMRAAGEPTVPSTLELELATNPFLRSTEPGVLEGLRAAGRLDGTSPETVFASTRGWKDVF